MNSEQIIEQALKLNLQERFIIVEALLNSLHEPDETIAEIWAEEAEKRLQAYREGRLAGLQWEMPEPMSLGPFKAPVEDWRLLANIA